MTDIQHIIQKHKTSCGIACVAMVTGKSYQEALLEARSHFRFTTNYLTWYRHRKKLLEINGLILKPLAKTDDWSSLPDFAFVITRNKKRGHCIVFRRYEGVGYFYDPEEKEAMSINYKAKMKLIGFEEVVKPS